MSKPLVIMGTIFAIIGSILGLGSFYEYEVARNFLKTASKAEGTVIELRERRNRSGSSISYTPVVEFTASGENHRIISNISRSPAAYKTGDTVEVLYDPQQPDKGKIKGTSEIWGLTMTLGGIGFGFTFLGTSILIYQKNRKRQIAWLKESGSRLQAQVTNVRQNMSVKVNGRNPWVIDCQCDHEASGKILKFTSENIWRDPSSELPKNSAISVFIAANNPKIYWVEIPNISQKKPAA